MLTCKKCIRLAAKIIKLEAEKAELKKQLKVLKEKYYEFPMGKQLKEVK